jgi:hypothetical protein
MDLNVKLWGLKYNFRKVRGVFLQNYIAPIVFQNYLIILLL